MLARHVKYRGKDMKQMSITPKQAQAIWQAHHRVATTTRYSTWAKKGGR